MRMTSRSARSLCALSQHESDSLVERVYFSMFFQFISAYIDGKTTEASYNIRIDLIRIQVSR